MIDQKNRLVNLIDEEKELTLNKPLECAGGKTVILRLLRLFNLRNRVELSALIGVSTGSIATWQTRNTTPFELLIRIHLATGVDLDFLLFGWHANIFVVEIWQVKFKSLPSTGID